MVHYEVTLMHKQTFEGKKVVVQAHDQDHAFQKATSMQASPRRWATLTAKVEGMMGSKFKHKGIRYNP
jgi:hypothetical protein